MGKLIDLCGQRFGFWLVKSKGENNKHGQTQWMCTCECGLEKLVTSNSLKTGNSTSCGCNCVPSLINQKFGKLIVKSLVLNKNNRRYWLCQCNCGKIIKISTYKLRAGLIESCGCDSFKKNVESLNKTNAIECFVKMLIPYTTYAKIVNKACMITDTDQINKLLVTIDHNDLLVLVK
jgi:hypothetical protein